MTGDGALFLYLLQHLALTALPLVAAMLLAARAGVTSIPVLFAIGLAGSGGTAILAFWAFYADPLLGRSFAYLVVFGSLALIASAIVGRRLDRALVAGLCLPLSLWALGCFFVAFLGFVHGGTETPLATAATRFAPQLPSDNDIPRFFADWFYENGHRGVPPVYPGEWLSSDRPPLQIGYVLMQRPFGWDEEVGLRYQTIGIVIQQLWILGLWALLAAARVGQVTRGLAMIAVLVSPLAILNGFYVWPKLLPAAMLLAALALVLTPLWSEVRRSAWGGALVAALLGVALLGHGGSAFVVIPIGLVVALRGLPDLRWLGVALAVGLLLVVPWMAYQSYGDPPGNRLSKWMLAGVIDVDERGAGETILDAYGEAGIGGTLGNKARNLQVMVGEPSVERFGDATVNLAGGELEEAVRTLREIFFSYLVPSLGLLLAALFAMAFAGARRRHPDEWRFGLWCLAFLLLGGLSWALLLFGNEAARATIHVGSYALPIIAACWAVVGLRATFPRFAAVVVGANALLMLAIYAPALDPLPGTGYSPTAALLAAAAFGTFVLLALKIGVGVPDRRDAGCEEIMAPMGR